MNDITFVGIMMDSETLHSKVSARYRSFDLSNPNSPSPMGIHALTRKPNLRSGLIYLSIFPLFLLLSTRQHRIVHRNCKTEKNFIMYIFVWKIIQRRKLCSINAAGVRFYRDERNEQNTKIKTEFGFRGVKLIIHNCGYQSSLFQCYQRTRTIRCERVIEIRTYCPPNSSALQLNTLCGSICI